MFNSNNSNNLKENSSSPPSIAIKLLLWCLPKHSAECILGDLEEEFYLRSKRNVNAAKYWFWLQTINSSGIYVRQKIASLTTLTTVTVILPLILFNIIFQLIVWLHNSDSLENFSPFFLDTLVNGKIHMAIFELAFWQQIPQTWSQVSGWSFLLDESSLIFTILSGCLYIYLDRCQKYSAHQMALFGCGVVFIPYILGISYINVYAFPAHLVGPVLSFTLLNALYLILPVTYIMLKKIKRQANQNYL